MRLLKHVIGGELLAGDLSTSNFGYNPALGQQVARVPYATSRDVDNAVEIAKTAFKEWSQTPVPVRSKIMFKFRNKIVDNMEELALLISEEHGKNMRVFN